MEKELCFYGCGQKAKYRFLNGKYCCEEIVKRCPEINNKASKKLKGIPLTEETKRKLSNSHKGKKHTKEQKVKISNSLKKLWKNPEFAEKIFCSTITSPNSHETVLLKLLNKLFPNKWKFVGDGKLWIGGKNPDFVNDSNTKLIEYFGDYWHSKEQTGLSNDVHEQQRIEHFKHYDYKVLVIWENELGNTKNVIQKIEEFNNND